MGFRGRSGPLVGGPGASSPDRVRCRVRLRCALGAPPPRKDRGWCLCCNDKGLCRWSWLRSGNWQVAMGSFGQRVGGAMGSFRHAREDRAANAGQAGSQPGKGRGSGRGRSPRKIVVGRQREDAEGEAVAMEGTRVRTRGQRGGDGIEWAPSWSLALAEREARAGRRSATRGDRREGGDLPVPYYRDWDEGQSHKMVRTR